MSFSGGLAAVIQLIRSWTVRQGGPVKVTIDLGADGLVLENVDPRQQDQLVEAFLRAHEND